MLSPDELLVTPEDALSDLPTLSLVLLLLPLPLVPELLVAALTLVVVADTLALTGPGEAPRRRYLVGDGAVLPPKDTLMVIGECFVV
jgi:hypothetical protein